MDWLVKLVTVRNTILLLLGCALLRLAVFNYYRPLYWLQQRLYPPQGAAPASGQDILADLDRQENARLQARYRRLLAQLEQARAQGFDVDALERKARSAASLEPKFRRQALRILSEVEMDVPRARQGSGSTR